MIAALESKFFTELQTKIRKVCDRLSESHPVIGLVYMLLVMPLFLLVAIMVGIGSIPGVILNELFWGQVKVSEASESTKVLHDLSLIVLGGTSALIACIYIFPNVLPAPSPDGRCPTEPYC